MHPGIHHATDGFVVRCGQPGDALLLGVVVSPDGLADARVGEDQNQQRHQKHRAAVPSDVGALPPPLGEGAPAVEDVALGVDGLVREDEHLRRAARQRQCPRQADECACATHRPRAVRKRLADGVVAVDGGQHQDDGAEVGAEDLAELDALAEQVAALEAVREFPGELRQHVEERGHQVGDAQVEDVEVHARDFDATPEQDGRQDERVAHNGDGEDERQRGDLDARQLLIARRHGVNGGVVVDAAVHGRQRILTLPPHAAARHICGQRYDAMSHDLTTYEHTRSNFFVNGCHNCRTGTVVKVSVLVLEMVCSAGSEL